MRAVQVAALALASVVFVVAQVAAEALVVVEVRAEGDPPEGSVTLRAEGDGGAVFRCRVTAGQCRIDQVPGGRYVVTFSIQDGATTEPRSAMIPPSGTVTLVVPAPRED